MAQGGKSESCQPLVLSRCSGRIPCVALSNESQATGNAPVFLPPFFLMDGIVLAKGLGRPSRTFFECGSAASERACENKFWMGQRLGLPFAARKKGGLMGSGADAERRTGLGASPQARPRDVGALVGQGLAAAWLGPVKR
jgi:hypothetical protein